jgi:hypothetical protein
MSTGLTGEGNSGVNSKEEAAPKNSNKRLLYWAASLSILVLVAHAIDAPDHLKEWWVYASIFIVVGSAQFFYGIALFFQPWRYDESGGVRKDAERFARPYYILGIVLDAFAIVLYIITRTTGLPFLGHDAAAERVTVLSLAPIVVGVPLLCCLVLLLRRTRNSSGE